MATRKSVAVAHFKPYIHVLHRRAVVNGCMGLFDWTFRYLPFQVTHSPYEIPGDSTSRYVNPSDPKERMIINAMVSA